MADKVSLAKTIFVVSCTTMPKRWWVAYATNAPAINAGLYVAGNTLPATDSMNSAAKSYMHTLSPSDPIYEAARAFLSVISYMQRKDANGEYDTLPLCKDVVAHLIEVIEQWIIDQDLPFTSPDVGLKRASNMLHTILEVLS